MKKILFLIFLLLVLSACTAWAETYWVSSTGTKTTKTDCDGATPIDGADACTLAAANGFLLAGDTVYLRGGTSGSPVTYTIGAYSGSTPGVKPTHSGTVGKPITYSVYGDEYIIFDGNLTSGTMGIYIVGLSYIRVTGKSKWQWKITNVQIGLNIGPRSGSFTAVENSYNEIDFIWFNNNAYIDGQGNLVWQMAYYNYIHDCKFDQFGTQTNCNGCSDGDMFMFGVEDGYRIGNVTAYNIVTNCEFSNSGHSSFYVNGKYNVFRNNYAHNEPWISDGTYLYSYRVGETDGIMGHIGMNLIEGNRIGYAGPTMYGSGYLGGVGWKHAASDYVFRYNDFFNNQTVAITFYPQAVTYDRVSYNYVYNNTFYHNGYYVQPDGSFTMYEKAISLNHSSSPPYNYFNWVHHNVIKNNLFYDNANVYPSATTTVITYGQATRADSIATGVGKGNHIIENNFNYDWTIPKLNTNPLFTSTDISDKTSWVLPDFTLGAGSSAIDYGASYLTTATNSGESSTTLTVADASYFQDGKFGQVNADRFLPTVTTFKPDEIAIGTASNTVAISKIYTKLTLGTSPSTAWEVGDTITGTNGATSVVVAKVSDTEYTVRDLSGSTSLAYYLPGETLSNGTYAANQNTANTWYIRVASAVSGWEVGDTITGKTSGASCVISAVISSTVYTCHSYTRNVEPTRLTFSAEILTDAIGGGSGGNEVSFSNTYDAMYRLDYYPKMRNSNTIILAEAKTWNDEDPIWLYKKSDGTRVLYGSRTDAGAHEYQSSDTPPSQTVTVSTVGTGCTASHNGEYTVYAGDTLNVSYAVTNNYNTPTWGGTCPQTGTTTTVCTPTDTQTVVLTCGSKIAADAKVGAGNPGHRVGAGNPAHKRY